MVIDFKEIKSRFKTGLTLIGIIILALHKNEVEKLRRQMIDDYTEQIILNTNPTSGRKSLRGS